MIKNIFYDLDGTLLPMDTDVFVNGYFGMLCRKMAVLGYDSKELVKNIWTGTKAMVLNDGSLTNEDVFWNSFTKSYEDRPIKKEQLIYFYEHEFLDARKFVSSNPLVPEVIATGKKLVFRQVLATNPIFPVTATKTRAEWAGISLDDFETYTTYEDCHYCKPNLNYYRELLDRVGMKAEETLMVGNDVDEDMVAEKLGMKVFLITDCMINKHELDISGYNRGGFAELLDFLRSLPSPNA